MLKRLSGQQALEKELDLQKKKLEKERKKDEVKMRDTDFPEIAQGEGQELEEQQSAAQHVL